MDRAQSDRSAGGAVVVAAIIGETKVLLLKESTKPKPHRWKLVSETLKPGESVLDALCRGVSEEAGLKLAVHLVDGHVATITDHRLKAVKQLIPSHMVEGVLPHERHFWGLLTSDEVIISLSGKRLSSDPSENIVTQAFNLFDLEAVDLLPQHRELVKQIARHTGHAI